MPPPSARENLFGEAPPLEHVGYAHVALEQGIDIAPAGLTYAVPPELADLAVGERVMVPLGRGNKPVPGYVVERIEQPATADAKIKPILSRDAHRVSLPADLIDLARWIAGYYCCPLGMVFATMLPAAVKRGTGTVSQTMVGLPGEHDTPTRDDAGDGNPPKLTRLQKAVLTTAEQRAAAGHPWTEIKELADLAGARSISPVRQLIDKGVLVIKREETVVSDLDLRAQREAATLSRVMLNASQQRALDHLVAHLDEGFGVHLLHGVTGSGKTEVYLRAIEHVLAHAPRATAAPALNDDDDDHDTDDPTPPAALILVPEIALTPQTVARFLDRFDRVAVLHSGLTAAQRHAQWRRIRTGEADIVVGARSAVFAPLPNLRLIIVDEEHEHSYKQDQLPRYHGRDVAIKRAQLLNIPIVLGSATPSLESYYNALGELPPPPDAPATDRRRGLSQSEAPDARRRRAYHLLRLPDRVPGMKLPDVEIVDLTQERRKRYEYSGKAGVHLLSIRLEKVLQQTLDARGQAILLLNRRGYANYIACPDQRCGWMMRCQFCDVTMVYHRDGALPTGGYVQCHHCEAEQLLVELCPQCQRRVTVFGLGTQRVEEELARKFPTARALRMDSDAMRNGRDYQQSLDAFRRGEIDVLLGTQMIAKGLDFPGVRLVGVISADTALHLPDFRAAERTFQLMAQVAGRAGRSDQPGRVIVQTFNPDDPAIVAAAQHDYDTFAARELNTRAQVGLPPITRMARIVVRDKDHAACIQRATTLAHHLEQFNDQLHTGVRLRGPAPCPISRIAGQHRQQIELIAPQAAPLQRLLTALRNTRLLISDAHTAVDVDPVALL